MGVVGDVIDDYCSFTDFYKTIKHSFTLIQLSQGFCSATDAVSFSSTSTTPSFDCPPSQTNKQTDFYSSERGNLIFLTI